MHLSDYKGMIKAVLIVIYEYAGIKGKYNDQFNIERQD